MIDLARELRDHALDDDNMVLMSCAASRIDFLESELARLRDAIENAPPPECKYPNRCNAFRGFFKHLPDCNVSEFYIWKRDALEVKLG